MKLLGRYKNGNYITTIFSDGTKIRQTKDDEFKPSFAENCDIKITNMCDMNCPMCHENSTIDGQHGDIDMEFLNHLHPYTELACLDGDSVVYTKDGVKKIKDLKVGDKIYDDSFTLRKISNIQTTRKDAFELKGDYGFNVICSKDHPFMVNGKEVKAIDCVGKPFSIPNMPKDINKKVDITLDLAKYVTVANKKLPGSRGGKISDKYVRLFSNGLSINRYITLNEDLMYLYGLFAAEGSKKGITLNSNEINLANKAKKIWMENFGVKSKIYNFKPHAIALEFYSPKLINAFFVDFLKVGKGARNKTLSFLYDIDNKDFVKSTLYGLFDGDGAYRKRTKNGNTFYSVTLKTTSQKLAYDVAFLLLKYFGIQASVFHGMSPERKIEGRILKPSDYYMLDIYGNKAVELFYPKFVEKFGKIEMNAYSTYKTPKFKSIKKIGRRNLFDITLENGSHVFPVNGMVLTHNCGGGNALLHPQLIPFLEKLKKQKVIANITVNQKHFEEKQDLIKYLFENDLVKGIGVSLVNPTDDFISLIKQYPTAVIHTINGMLTKEQIEKLKDNNLKLLILGYKNFRRGTDYLASNENIISERQKYLYDNLEEMLKHFKLISFDNLALEQLCVRRLLSDEEWEQFYMGDDGTMTFYIDLVNKQFASSSISTKRYPIADSIDDMFKTILEEKDEAI